MIATENKPVPLRPASKVMRLSRLGSMHQCRLSFMRILTRRMAREGWTFDRPVFEIDDTGVGHAVFTAKTPQRVYSLVAFAHDLPPEMRSDRVIATAWDATFTLFDGVPTTQDIERLSKNVPVQEAGRVDAQSLSVSRANRSVRLWEHVVSALASGQQPDIETLKAVGYLMRTTAVYGSGKLGASDYDAISDRPEFSVPFQVEMLSVYLTRWFVRDLANHMAQVAGGDAAVDLAPDVAALLGIGNSTGLGLGPYIVNHPLLFNNWIMARETAIARVRTIETATDAEIAQFRRLVGQSKTLVDTWRSEHPVQVEKLLALRADVAKLQAHIASETFKGRRPWESLISWSESALTEEGQEMVASLILEPYGDLVDDLAATMADQNHEAAYIDGGMTVSEMKTLLEASNGWAFVLDWSKSENAARAWYVSEEKLEPRLGERFDEPIEPYETPLAPARDAAAAYRALRDWDGSKPIAAFLLRHPEHRYAIRRAQISAQAPYSEIHDNTIAADMFPVDMLRVKLSFFGATHFDPRSDRWLRICMFGDAPYPKDLTPDNADLWVYPQVTS